MDGNGDPPHTLIRDLPASDRPRERLRDAGASALSAQELLAILLRTGGSKESALAQAQRLLRDFGDLQGLEQAAFAELCNMHGIGEAKAAQIKAALELGIRAGDEKRRERIIVRGTDDVASMFLHDMSRLEQEHVRVVVLDARNRVISTPEVYRGSVHTAQVRIGELFREAVRTSAAGIVVVHNHPSGDPAPSAADTAMTKQLVEAGKLLDVDVFDHIIFAGGRYASMAELGLGFPRARP